MKMKSLAMMAAILLPMTALAADNGMRGPMAGHDMSGMQGGMGGGMSSGMSGGMSQKKMFLEKKEIDGYTVSFHVMPSSEGMQHGGSFNFMLKIEKGGKPADVVAANSKVKHPNGQEESKMMMKMGDWFMAGYDLGEYGQYQLMVLFKTADGSKHFGGVYYPDKP